MADRAPKGTARKPPAGCKVNELFALLGRPHALDILHVLLTEPRAPRRFVELQQALELSPKTLAARLKGLVDAGLLTRRAYNEIPPRVDYEATQKAMELGPLFSTLQGWCRRNDLEPVPVATAPRGG